MLVQASQDALRHLEIIMVGTKFPENIGMAARACANTGCGRLTLVSPAWWDKEKARPLATAKGEPLLDAIEVKPTLGDALAPNVLTFGTTARTGGVRRIKFSSLSTGAAPADTATSSRQCVPPMSSAPKFNRTCTNLSP